LKSWILQIDLSENEQTDVLTEWMIDMLFKMTSTTENMLSVNYKDLKDWDRAQHYQEQSVFHVKQIKDKVDRTQKVFDALEYLGDLYHNVNKVSEAKAIFEEG
jgi:hypothetical protein